MKRSVVETVLGAVILLAAATFLIFSYKTAQVKASKGYEISADFSGIGGLSAGDDVAVSGVKVGTVAGVTLNQDTYLAHVTMTINRSIKLPDDTAAVIGSQSLLGGRYLSLEPGSSEDMLKPGDKIQYTQAPQNLEELLGKFIFSMNSKPGSNNADNNNTASAVAPTPAPAAGADAHP